MSVYSSSSGTSSRKTMLPSYADVYHSRLTNYLHRDRQEMRARPPPVFVSPMLIENNEVQWWPEAQLMSSSVLSSQSVAQSSRSVPKPKNNTRISHLLSTILQPRSADDGIPIAIPGKMISIGVGTDSDPLDNAMIDPLSNVTTTAATMQSHDIPPAVTTISQSSVSQSSTSLKAVTSYVSSPIELITPVPRRSKPIQRRLSSSSSASRVMDTTRTPSPTTLYADNDTVFMVPQFSRLLGLRTAAFSSNGHAEIARIPKLLVNNVVKKEQSKNTDVQNTKVNNAGLPPRVPAPNLEQVQYAPPAVINNVKQSISVADDNIFVDNMYWKEGFMFALDTGDATINDSTCNASDGEENGNDVVPTSSEATSSNVDIPVLPVSLGSESAEFVLSSSELVNESLDFTLLNLAQPDRDVTPIKTMLPELFTYGADAHACLCHNCSDKNLDNDEVDSDNCLHQQRDSVVRISAEIDALMSPLSFMANNRDSITECDDLKSASSSIQTTPEKIEIENCDTVKDDTVVLLPRELKTKKKKIKIKTIQKSSGQGFENLVTIVDLKVKTQVTNPFLFDPRVHAHTQTTAAATAVQSLDNTKRRSIGKRVASEDKKKKKDKHSMSKSGSDRSNESDSSTTSLTDNKNVDEQEVVQGYHATNLVSNAGIEKLDDSVKNHFKQVMYLVKKYMTIQQNNQMRNEFGSHDDDSFQHLWAPLVQYFIDVAPAGGASGTVRDADDLIYYVKFVPSSIESNAIRPIIVPRPRIGSSLPAFDDISVDWQSTVGLNIVLREFNYGVTVIRARSDTRVIISEIDLNVQASIVFIPTKIPPMRENDDSTSSANNAPAVIPKMSSSAFYAALADAYMPASSRTSNDGVYLSADVEDSQPIASLSYPIVTFTMQNDVPNKMCIGVNEVLMFKLYANHTSTDRQEAAPIIIFDGIVEYSSLKKAFFNAREQRSGYLQRAPHIHQQELLTLKDQHQQEKVHIVLGLSDDSINAINNPQRGKAEDRNQTSSLASSSGFSGFVRSMSPAVNTSSQIDNSAASQGSLLQGMFSAVSAVKDSVKGVLSARVDPLDDEEDYQINVCVSIVRMHIDETLERLLPR